MLRRNLIANYLGQGWAALMGLAFVPLYIRYLGVEAYGVIGLFAVLQAWLALLDLGLTPTLAREMARLAGGAHTPASIRDLLRSVECVAAAIALCVGLGVGAASGWLASDWVKAGQLPLHAISNAFLVMGWITGLHFLEGIYRSAIAGLQKQVLLNVVNAVMATLRAAGALGVLAWLSPTLQAYFLWQGLASVATIGVLALVTYRSLPRSDHRARFSPSSLHGVRKFAGGMVGIALLSLLITQLDKVLLSRLLSLADFGYYSIAATVATVVFMGIGPIQATWYPRLCELHARMEDAAMAAAYHHACQLVAVVGGSMALVICFFSHELLLVWSGDPTLAARAAPLVSVLVLGNLLNCLMVMPYQAQLAYGWTSLTIGINIVMVAVIVPALLQVTPRWGALGAAWVWVAVNALYILVAVQWMYGRILRGEKLKWYVQDILLPLGPAAAVAAWMHYLVPSGVGRLSLAAYLLAAGCMTALAAAAGSSVVRSAARRLVTDQRAARPAA